MWSILSIDSPKMLSPKFIQFSAWLYYCNVCMKSMCRNRVIEMACIEHFNAHIKAWVFLPEMSKSIVHHKYFVIYLSHWFWNLILGQLTNDCAAVAPTTIHWSCLWFFFVCWFDLFSVYNIQQAMNIYLFYKCNTVHDAIFVWSWCCALGVLFPEILQCKLCSLWCNDPII